MRAVRRSQRLPVNTVDAWREPYVYTKTASVLLVTGSAGAEPVEGIFFRFANRSGSDSQSSAASVVRGMLHMYILL